MILVTGGTGLVGSELVRQLVQAGHAVRVLHRADSTFDLLADVKEKIFTVPGDVLDPESLTKAMEGVDWVFHTAAALGFGGDKKQRSRMFSVNVQGTAHVADAARKAGIRRFVHTSSMAALGRRSGSAEVIDENAVWIESELNTAYAQTKYAAELEIHRAIAEGLDAVIVNPALVFGTGRSGENTWELVEKTASGRLPGIPSGGTNVVDVRDVVAGHILAMKKGLCGERYFLGSENLSWKVILTTLASALDVHPPRRVVPAKMAIRIAGFFELAGKLTGTSPLVNRETARVSALSFSYSNQKAIDHLGCTFRPFSETAADLATEWHKRNESAVG